MALFQKNIWLLFGIIAAAGLLFSFAAILITQNEVKQDIISGQK